MDGESAIVFSSAESLLSHGEQDFSIAGDARGRIMRMLEANA
jgi:hypothetical protein